MVDIACSLCQKGYYRQNNECVTCTDTGSSEFNYPTLPSIFGTVVVLLLYYYMWDQAEVWGSFVNELWSLAFVLLVHFQIVGLVLGTAVSWPTKMFDNLYVWEYFVDVTDMLRLDCIGDSRKYRGFP